MDITRETARTDIECEEDVISFNCSIVSNSETLHLTWHITFPGLMPLSFTYNSSSTLHSYYYLPFNTTIILSQYLEDEYIESILYFEVMRNVTITGTTVECEIEDLGYISEILIVDTSSKCKTETETEA